MSSPAAPERIGHYRIDSLLGRGGMGEVYLAWDERLRRHVALKRIRADGPASDTQRARFRREARATARMSHPAIVPIFDILEETGAGDCIVMEYVEGTTLSSMLSAGPLGPAQAVRLMAQVAGGLGEAHAKGIVHRDLKGSNVLVTPAGQARILDFGLARSLFGDGEDSAQTREGMILGTVHSMSPEQARGRPVDHRSDLFSLGVLLYELLAGRSPFQGADAIDTLRRIGSESPPPLQSSQPGLPADLYALVERLLEKDPERRPANARVVEGELLRLAALPLPEKPGAAAQAPAADVDPLGETASRANPVPPEAPAGPAVAPSAGAKDLEAWRPVAGEAIPGRSLFILEERLGEGGFGEVWRAVHKSGEQRVFKFCFDADRLRALKREVTLFRLIQEGLGHCESIARILDWSLESPPYFLESEYTEGGSLPRWAEAQGGAGKVPLARRLALVAEVADALAAAHSVGVLHKDVKPDNVLVTVDREGVPHARLADFGIGLLTDEERLNASGVTALGFTRPGDAATPSGGTLRYMAPELVEGKPATLQADIYSLGVLLYQMAAADLSRPLAPGWTRDVVDPLLAEDIAQMVDGDPARRPSSAREVADLLRQMDERRAARESEARERQALARAQRRRRTAAAVAAATSAMLVVASGFAAYALRARSREEVARQDAERHRRQAEKLVGFMLGDLREKLEPAGRLAILKDVGDQALEYFAAIPEERLSPEELLLRSKAMAQVGQVRFGLGDSDGADKAFSESLSLSRRLAAENPASDELQFGLGQSEFWSGFLRLQRSDWKGAREHFQRYLDASNALVARDPRKPEWRLELAYAHSNLASVDEATGDAVSAGRALGASVSILETLLSESPGDERLATELAHVYGKLGAVEEQRGRLAESLGWFRKNAAALGVLSKQRPDDINLLRYLGLARGHVGDLLRLRGDTEAALAEHEAELDLARRVSGHDPENVAWRAELILRHDKVGRDRRARREWTQAMKHFEAGREIARALAAAAPDRRDHRYLLACLGESVASVQLATGHARQARSELRAVVAALEALVSDSPGDREFALTLGASLWRLGVAESAMGEAASARAAWERSLSVVGRPEDRDPRALGVTARALLSLGRWETARPVLAALEEMGAREEELARFRAQVESTGKVGSGG